MADLTWLPVPPSDLRQQVRRLDSLASEATALARQLSGYRLNGSQIHLLGAAIARLSAHQPNVVRLGVLSNGNVDLLLPALTVSALRHGIWLQVESTTFDQVAPEALNPASGINRARCHFVLLALDHRGLPLACTPGDENGARVTVKAALDYVDSLRRSMHNASGATVILQTIPQVASGLFGSLERQVPGTLQWLIQQYNQELLARVVGSSDLVLDAAALAEVAGLDRWHDPVQWASGKFPFAHEMMPLYADWAARLIAAARGKSRKCLVLDLDNTLWGGVVGDDGLAGIIVGNGSPVGEAFLEIQKTVIALRERGVVLAVSSKNDDAVARRPFQSHPEMLLREQHFAVFQANWQDKASNLKAIAETLNLGMDSLVLLDDNPAERAQVRQALPEVAVPELPDDPAYYPRVLLAAGYFEAIGFTVEDRQRAEQYQANAARAELLGDATDLTSYLESLSMKAVCAPFDELGRIRIAQLINKSNQFNLTTRRYTESDVQALETSERGLTLQLRLIDRFGDNGMVVVVICCEAFPDWLIDTWLMSCRVLNRQLEQATLNYLVSRAHKVGVRALIGEYLKTDRNGMVEQHYARLGFQLLSGTETQSLWRLDVANYLPVPVPIEIVESARVDPCAREKVVA